MKTYEFTIKVRVSGNATEQEVRDYMSLECGASCQISKGNPFLDEDSDANIEDVDLF